MPTTAGPAVPVLLGIRAGIKRGLEREASVTVKTRAIGLSSEFNL